MMAKMIALVCLGALMCSGCAFRKMVPYEVTSIPSGAPIEVNGVYMGKTPMQIQLGTLKRWVGLYHSPSGWGYTADLYYVTAYPPPDSEETLYSQTKTLRPRETVKGGALFFDLRLKSVSPTQPIEIRER